MTTRLPVLRGQRKRYLMVVAWVLVVGFVVSIWLLYGRHWLQPEEWNDWVSDNLMLASVLYFAALSLRGVFLIPSTPLLFAGIVLFPGVWVWVFNMAGILTSSALVYTLVRAFGFDFMVRHKYRARVRQLSALLRQHDFKVIIGWSIFPAVPTDVIVYTAATLRLPLLRCLTAVGIGKGVLFTFYVAGGSQLWSSMV